MMNNCCRVTTGACLAVGLCYSALGTIVALDMTTEAVLGEETANKIRAFVGISTFVITPATFIFWKTTKSAAGSVNQRIAKIAPLISDAASLMYLKVFYQTRFLPSSDQQKSKESITEFLQKAAQYGYLKTLEFAFSKSIFGTNPSKLLATAIEHNQLKTAEFLLNCGASLRYSIELIRSTEALDFFFTHGFPAYIIFPDGNSWLHKIDQPGLVAHLVKNGADPNATNTQGTNPLHSQWRFPKMQIALVENGADVTRTFPRSTELPLHSAQPTGCEIGVQRQLARLLSQNGKLINAQTSGDTPLHLAYDPEWTQVLLELGADPSIKNANGHTPLNGPEIRVPISHRGDHRRFLALIQADPTVSEPGSDGRTPLQVLLAQPTADVVTPSTLELCDSLHQVGANPNVTTPAGNTALHLFLRQFDHHAATPEDLCKVVHPFLLRKDFDVNSRDQQGLTILDHLFDIYVKYKRPQSLIPLIVRLLQRGGQSRFLDPVTQETWMHRILKRFNLEDQMSFLPLLDKNSPHLREIRDREGLTPLLVAMRKNYKEVLAYFRSNPPHRLGEALWKPKDVFACQRLQVTSPEEAPLTE